MLTFLHLSDLHLTTKDAGSQFDLDFKIREALLDDLGKEERTKFDAILVTGDIAYHGQALEFARAKDWLELVRTATESSPEALFMVPGNHDVDRKRVDKESALWDLHQTIRAKASKSERSASLAKKLHDPFDFLTALIDYRAFAAEYACPTNPKALAWVQVLDAGRELEDGSKVRFHGLNSALLSDGADIKANLLLDEVQFGHFDNKAEYVNLVLCHHPHPWLLDGNEANDHFRKQAHVVLSGHEHDNRCYMEGGSLRILAGAVHPSRGETPWEPGYNILKLSIETNSERILIAEVEHRIWLDKEKRFGPKASTSERFPIKLPTWAKPPVSKLSGALVGQSTIVGTLTVKDMTQSPTPDAIQAARRKLIVHFFRLGVIDRHNVAKTLGILEEGDDALTGQARWARMFERAEKLKKFGDLWNEVAKLDSTLHGQPNPFNP